MTRTKEQVKADLDKVKQYAGGPMGGSSWALDKWLALVSELAKLERNDNDRT